LQTIQFPSKSDPDCNLFQPEEEKICPNKLVTVSGPEKVVCYPNLGISCPFLWPTQFRWIIFRMWPFLGIFPMPPWRLRTSFDSMIGI
jgi:hypothetical protein